MTRVGLTMIVKDEAAVIERCLASVRPLLAWWTVVDTGSTDGTQDLVRRALAGLPGELVEQEWVDFGTNRDRALDVARRTASARPDDYVLWIDADEHLDDLPDAWPELDLDGYHLPVDYAGVRYGRLALVRLQTPWRWRGVLHEALALEGRDARLGSLPAPRVVVAHDGARAHDPTTYRRDAALLEADLATRPGDPRTQFYLAQSWRDAGDDERALAAYAVRAGNAEGWDQERYVALLELARCRERLGHPADLVVTAYLDAVAVRPDRAEALVELARLERTRGRHGTGLVFARAAAALPEPGLDALFVERDAYGWRALDELAVNAYWTGAREEGLAAARLAAAARPEDPRLAANVTWFLEA